MNEQLKNLINGLFVISACAIIILMILFLHPSVGNEGRTLKVRFADIDKISRGTRVTFGGKPVGEVMAIRELPDIITERTTTNGYVYVYELTLKVDSSVNVYNSDEIEAKTSGLLGEKTISITPMAPPPGKPLILVNDKVLYAVEAGSVEETLKELRDIGAKLESALDAVTDNLKEFKLRGVWEKVSDIGGNLRDITAALNKPEILTSTLDNMQAFSDQLVQSFKDISAITGQARKGEGTFGKIFMKEDIYLKVNALLAKADTILNDINHYGLLFHSDKGWQRLRARRLNLLNRLCSPQEFRNFFNDEMDQISTSLSRVYMVLDETESSCCCEVMIENREYDKVYAELLRRVESLQESLKMYNQQVMDLDIRNWELEKTEN